MDNPPERNTAPVIQADRELFYDIFHAYPIDGCPHSELTLGKIAAFRLSSISPAEGALRAEASFERLGEALFALSAKLLASGFLDHQDNHSAYERVVAEFESLTPTETGEQGK